MSENVKYFLWKFSTLPIENYWIPKDLNFLASCSENMHAFTIF